MRPLVIAKSREDLTHQSLQNLSSQQGASVICWLVFLFFGLLLLQLAVKIIPVYYQDYCVKKALESVANDETVTELSIADIRSRINKNFVINRVDGAAVNAVDAQYLVNKIVVDITYEERIPLIGNLDLIFSFSHYFDTSQPHKCCTPP